MAVESLFPTSSTLFILLLPLLLFQTSLARPYNCTPSACGIIPNISFPFHLIGHPRHCGYVELACENNITSLHLNSHKFYVKEINYTDDASYYTDDASYYTYDATMRVVDASINNDICSFPTATYDWDRYYQLYIPYWYHIHFVSCPHPLKNSSNFTETTPCQTHNSRFTYIWVGSMTASAVPETCRVDVEAMTSWTGFKDFKNTSLEEINSALLYGFELNIGHPPEATKWEKFIYQYREKVQHKHFTVPLLIVLVIAVNPFVVKGLYIGGDGYETFDSSMAGFISSMCIIFAPRIITCSFIVWFLIHKFRRRHASKFYAIENFLQSDNKLVPIRYSYSNIKAVTRNFRNKLGEGGYGSVYKGTLRSGYHVAVKVLGKSEAIGQDFINEIATIGRIHHVNIVKLVGYCAEGSKCALVFDFMSNGSLEKYIFNRENMISLNWDKKFEIVLGVARGIAYLHQGCDIQILHFDIKPHNILLDEQFIPKISDFGLAKVCSVEKNTMTLTAARGTIGYVAPELINRGIGRVSYKADVYSFGMLLIEMVGLRQDLTTNDDESSKYFPCWIYDRFNQDMDIIIGNIDENDNNEEDDGMEKVVRKMTIVALWCIQMNPDNRPSMNKVLEMLEGEVKHLKVPPYPTESCHVLVNEDETWGADSSDSTSLLYHDDAPTVEITIEDML